MGKHEILTQTLDKLAQSCEKSIKSRCFRFLAVLRDFDDVITAQK